MADLTCSIPGCSRDILCRGWCKLHYERWRTKGSAEWQPKSVDDRFWSKVDKSDGCWAWLGSVDASTGYGRFWSEGRMNGAHRFAFESANGFKIPSGMVIDHLCHNGSGCPGGASCEHRRCVNPTHLAVATNADNIARGQSRARKSHCPAGHPYDGENLYVDPNGRRHCRICGRARTRAWYRRRNGAQP